MWPMLIIFVCIVINAALAAIEIAFVSVNSALVKDRAKSGDDRAMKLLVLKSRPERTLSTIQIGITLLSAISAAVGGTAAGLNIVPLLQDQFGLPFTAAELLAVLIVVLPITYLSVVFGEITPKALALRSPYYYAAQGTSTLRILSKLLYPAVRICELSTIELLKHLPFHKMGDAERVKEDQEYEEVLKSYRKLSRKAKEYMFNLEKLEDKTVADILLEWKRVDYITADSDLKDVENKIISSGHTRMPVLQNDKVIGFINTKEILALSRSRKDDAWKKLIRQPLTFSHESHPIKVLTALQKEHMHMGIVQDKNGKPLGVITIEDIIEDVLGDIYDEDDEGSLRQILE